MDFSSINHPATGATPIGKHQIDKLSRPSCNINAKSSSYAGDRLDELGMWPFSPENPIRSPIPPGSCSTNRRRNHGGFFEV